jgi:hypothetical protein
VSLDLHALVLKYWELSKKALNPDELPEGMDGTRAQILMSEFVSTKDCTLEELMFALYGAAVMTAVAMDEKLHPVPVENDIALIQKLNEEDLLRFWFFLGELDPWDRSQVLTNAVLAEFKRRGMPVVRHTGI